jgi:hypothetical protein
MFARLHARLLAFAAAMLCGRSAPADIVPPEAFISAAPAPWDRREPDPRFAEAPAAPPEVDDVVLRSVTASLELFPTAAIVRTTAVVQGPAGASRRVGIPTFTSWVHAAPLSELEVVVDGRRVAAEFVAPPWEGQGIHRRRPRDDWWVWPLTFPSAEPVTIEIRYTQALTDAEVWAGKLHTGAVHVIAGGARWQRPIGAVEFSLRLHGLSTDDMRSLPAPTSVGPDGLVWRSTDVAPDRYGFGVVIDLPLAKLPGRDVPRAAYFPADAPEHLVLQDYVNRFAVVCTAPTSDEWERLVAVLREAAERSQHPLARSWAAATLGDLREWCSFGPGEAGDPEVVRCKQWLAAPASGTSPGTLAVPPACWEDSELAKANLLRAAERVRRRRIGLWGAGVAALVVAAGIGLWVRRRRPAPDPRPR